MQYAVSTDNSVIEDPAIRQAFIKACTAVRTILQFMKQRSLTEADTVALHRRCMSIGPLFRKLMEVIPAEEELNLDIPKIHACIHFAAFIRMFGCGMNLIPAQMNGYIKRWSVTYLPKTAGARRTDCIECWR
jgi:hypothetical protein